MCAVSFSEKTEKYRNMLRRFVSGTFFAHKWANGKVHRFSPPVAKNFPNKLGNMHSCAHAVPTYGEASP
mgnify:FL=1